MMQIYEKKKNTLKQSQDNNKRSIYLRSFGEIQPNVYWKY